MRDNILRSYPSIEQNLLVMYLTFGGLNILKISFLTSIFN